jgi:hypothetical protein
MMMMMIKNKMKKVKLKMKITKWGKYRVHNTTWPVRAIQFIYNAHKRATEVKATYNIYK